MKYIIFTISFFFYISLVAQRDFYIDTSFQPSECVQSIMNMVADAEGGIIFTHLRAFNPCFPLHEHQFMRMARVDKQTGEYDFNFSTPFPWSTFYGNIINRYSNIYVVGLTETSGFNSPDWVHKIDVYGSRDTTWFPWGNYLGKVFDMIDREDYYLIAGSRLRTLLQPDTVIENNTIFKFDKNFIRDTSFVIEATYKIGDSLYLPHATAIIHIIPVENKYLINGAFFTVNGFISPWIARIDENGNVDTTFKNNEIIGQKVNDWHVTEDSKVILAGAFRIDVQGEEQRSCLIRLNVDGSLDTTFNNTFNMYNNSQTLDKIHEIAKFVVVSPDTMLMVGFFDEFQGKKREGIVMTDGNGFLIEDYFDGIGITGWSQNDSARAEVRDIIQTGIDTFVIGGNFRRFAGHLHRDFIRIVKPKVTSLTESKNTKVKFSLLPNPAGDFVQIYSDEISTTSGYPLHVRITDLTGKQVWSGKTDIHDRSIHTGFLASGTYIVHVQNNTGQYGVEKLVIMR